MTYIAFRMPTTIRMHIKTMTKLLVVSVAILAGSPALATQIARHDVHCRISEQKPGAFRHQAFGPCISPEVSMRRIGTPGIKRTMIGRPILSWDNSRSHYLRAAWRTAKAAPTAALPARRSAR
jgi:hypothetical protein